MQKFFQQFKMDATPMDEYMEQWLIKQQIVDEELNKLRECSDVQAKLTQDFFKSQSAIDDVNKEIQSIENNLTNLAGGHEIIRLQLEAWRDTFEKANDECNQRKLKLDETQNQIWKIRREYCDDVEQFIEKYGIQATIKCNFERNVRQQLATALDDIHMDTESNFTEKKKSEGVIRMESEIDTEKKVLEDLEKKLKEIQKMNEGLNSALDSAECISLRNALKYSRDETRKYQEELNDLQTQLDAMNTNIVNNLFEDNLASDGNTTNQPIRPSFVQETSTTQSFNNNNSTTMTEFVSAKDVYKTTRNNITTNDIIVQPQTWKNYRTQPSTSLAQYKVVDIIENYSTLTQDSNMNFNTNSFSTENPAPVKVVRNDPYKRIMEIKENARLNKKQKGKFKLLNNQK